MEIGDLKFVCRVKFMSSTTNYAHKNRTGETNWLDNVNLPLKESASKKVPSTLLQFLTDNLISSSPSILTFFTIDDHLCHSSGASTSTVALSIHESPSLHNNGSLPTPLLTSIYLFQRLRNQQTRDLWRRHNGKWQNSWFLPLGWDCRGVADLSWTSEPCAFPKIAQTSLSCLPNWLPAFSSGSD